MIYLRKSCLIGTLTILCLIFSSFNNNSIVYIDYNSQTISIEQALKSNLISCKIASNGGYQGNCIHVKLSNNCENNLKIKIEAGRNFESADTLAQDILVVKDQIIVLNTGETQESNIFGFCSQSYNNSPKTGSIYAVGKMKDENTVKLAQFLGKNKFPMSAIQSAIWTVTDKIPIAAIFDKNRDTIVSLQNFVASLTGQKPSWYSVDYEQNSEHLFTGNALGVVGTIHQKIDANTEVKVVVYDIFNVSQIRTEFYVENDSDSHEVSLDVRNLPKGKYFVRFYILGVAERIDEKVINI